MSYDPDILIRKDEFDKAFKEDFKDVYDFDEVLSEARTKVLKEKKNEGLRIVYAITKKLEKQEEEIVRELNKNKSITRDELFLLKKKRLEKAKDRQKLLEEQEELNKKIDNIAEDHPRCAIYNKMGKEQTEADATIEGKEYYWITTEYSAETYGIIEWLKKHNVAYVVSH